MLQPPRTRQKNVTGVKGGNMEKEQRYNVEQYFTQGWDIVGANMTKDEATKRLDALQAEGFVPSDLRVRKVV